MILLPLLLLTSDPYGPIIDPRTGKQCPATEYHLGLWDEPDFTIRDIMNTTASEAGYCTTLRYRALQKARAANRGSRPPRKR